MDSTAKDIAIFEANKFYSKYRQEWDDERIELMEKEAKVDFVLAMAFGFFFMTLFMVALRAYGIWE